MQTSLKNVFLEMHGNGTREWLKTVTYYSFSNNNTSRIIVQKRMIHIQG